MVTVLPESEQPPLGVTMTVRPDVEVGLTPNELLNAAEDGAVKVMVCDASVAVTVRCTLGAGCQVALPGCDAVSVHAVVPLVIVTVAPLIEQPPLGVTVTVSPDVAV